MVLGAFFKKLKCQDFVSDPQIVLWFWFDLRVDNDWNNQGFGVVGDSAVNARQTSLHTWSGPQPYARDVTQPYKRGWTQETLKVSHLFPYLFTHNRPYLGLLRWAEYKPKRWCPRLCLLGWIHKKTLKVSFLFARLNTVNPKGVIPACFLIFVRAKIPHGVVPVCLLPWAQ